MELSQVIKTLYSNNFREILKIINYAEHANKYPFDENNTSIIHTGFLFEIQNEKKIELYYDLINKTVIRQPKFNDYPAVLGLVYFFWNGWIKVWEHIMVVKVDEINDELLTIKFDKAEEVFDFAKFEIVSESSSLVLDTLTFTLPQILRFDGETFR